MYIKKVSISNLGPIESLTIEPKFDTNQNPNITVLVGANGAGKSVLLSTIVDTMVEARKRAWNKIPEIAHDKYIRYMSHGYVRSGANYSFSEIAIQSATASVVQTEIVSNVDEQTFAQKYPTVTMPPHNPANFRQQLFENGGFQKNTNTTGEFKKEIQSGVMLYFPYFRYELPAWLNEETNVSFSLGQKMFGTTTVPVVMTDLVEATSRWLVDAVLDRELYEKRIQQFRVQGHEVPIFLGYDGPNSRIFDLVSIVLTKILVRKESSIQAARIGVGTKGGRNVSVMVTGKDGEVLPATHQLAGLSSGELMILCLFCTIIRAYEAQHGQPPTSLADIQGIVLVDEIDLHLHLRLQMEVLPEILAMFPKVQFVLTTHSPFFLLGLTKQAASKTDIYSLPLGVGMSIDDFSEFQFAYDVFVEKNKQYKENYEGLRVSLGLSNTPLVITEGKTDWKHLKAARERLLASTEIADIPYVFLEYENEFDMGDTKLAQMCEDMARLPQPRRLLFIFDRDNPSIVQKMSGVDQPFKAWGNNVFSACIPSPAHRDGYQNVSIEFFYTDDEVRTVNPPTGRRLFFTNELETFGRPNKGPSGVRVLDVPHANEELTKKVYDKDCDTIVDAQDHKVGHSKSAFAELVLNGTPPFDTFDLTEMKRIFLLIEQILAV